MLELDAHGTNDWSALAPTNDGLGVRRGDFVFIHREGTTNGVEAPMVPRIGEVEEWVRDPPVAMQNGRYNGWRGHMQDIGMRIAEEHAKSEQSVVEPPIRRPQKGDTSLNWFGEVTNVSPRFLRCDNACSLVTVV